MRKPSALRSGDTIGIVAPSSPVPEEDLRKGIAVLEARGYRVVVGPHVLATAPHCAYLAGSDRQRADDLNAFFVRRDIDAIFCARGGYGATRLLNLLDWEIIADTPKIFVGYSDITALHTAITRLAGWVTFHSPMVTALPNLNDTASQVLWRLLEEPAPLGDLPADPASMQTVVPGIVEGELAGGCLCLLSHACGSRFAPDFREKIVVLEDVNDAVYHADRDLAQLYHAGLLEQAAGFVLGSLTHWQKHEADPPLNTPAALWKDIFEPLGKPTISGFPFGHEPNPLALPLGVRVRLDANTRTLTLLESATK
jgi:muramoyltetrapeptide carboxypeptidase